MTEIVTYGQIAYEAYAAHSDGKSLVSGEPLPAWGEQKPSIRRAWNAAGNAVSDDVISDGLDKTEPGALTLIRTRLADLAAGLELSASASHPSKKSEIEHGCAEAVRGIAEGR
ncbi:MAG TPA: hypothetical protein VK586_15845 [Streptosporangiaceae bacterium]|nr:hypothetical protein [Streptosporangiaceae bacterium]